MALLVHILTVAGAVLSGGVACAPVVEHGAEALGWTQVVRRRHLYAARTGLHLLISADGHVHGSVDQSPYSLLEITPLSPGCVALRGVASERFLCMREDATLYTSRAYLREDCSFREQVLADGYSAYSSDTHGLLLSLGSPRQRQRGRDRGAPALAQFLPRVSTLEGPALPRLPPSVPPLTTHPQEPLEHMEAFGKLSQIIHSPSFHER
ncbi:fibroblast growth factor 19 [Periophthalmus magnuspinnatus]|uniref:fibroblast growth factor 19 n=1 Tax=Periophthalmus magnuspinnatus TaxID=409849 RepID=UPI00145A3EDC|nr:fibroblast growth factor 19 [Periophthalmus magnuspinnatus]